MPRLDAWHYAVCCLCNADVVSMPVIETGYYMYNWSKFIFTWTHGSNDLTFNTYYYAWYRSRYIFALLSPLAGGGGKGNSYSQSFRELIPCVTWMGWDMWTCVGMDGDNASHCRCNCRSPWSQLVLEFFAFTSAIISVPVGTKWSSCPQANFAPLPSWIEDDIVL